MTRGKAQERTAPIIGEERARQMRRIAKRFAEIEHDDEIVDMTTLRIARYEAQQRVRIDLDRLEAADQFTFLHDVYGILRAEHDPTGIHARTFAPRCGMETA